MADRHSPPGPSSRRRNSVPRPASTRSRTSSRGKRSTEESKADRTTEPLPDTDANNTLDSDGQQRKKRELLHVPQPSSQQSSEDTPTDTGLSGATAADSESIGQSSKRSFLGKRRAGSSASSKRSQTKPVKSEKPSEKPLQPPSAQPSPTTTETSSKKKAKGGFLSFLCCGVPKGDNAVDQEDDTEASRKATKLRPPRSTQSTPVKKQDVSAAESSTADSKDPTDEKAAYESQNPSAEKKEPEKPMQGDATVEAPEPPTINRPRAASAAKRPLDQPLPPLPNQPDRLDTTSAQPAAPQVNVQAPTPITPAEEQAIHDRTPEQEARDTDIEMTDAPPSIPISRNEVHTAEEDQSHGQSAQKDAGPVRAELPPPPPLAERQAQTANSSVTSPQAQESSVTATPADQPQQKWLLPPIRPEFKGKKCLVLDLDETLVHSSFKVKCP
jgi:carboxy-terminal domain RNA polymerase II polypeptide A small phosphatase